MQAQLRAFIVTAMIAMPATALLPRPAVAQDIVIGTGSTSGVYYHLGRVLCRMVTRVDPVEGMTCTAEPTAGSIDNLEALRNGDVQIGVVQSDWQYHAVNGSGPFSETGPDTELRALFSVHNEAFTLIVRNDSGIADFTQLPGRRVNTGNPGSGHRGTMDALMTAMGWTDAEFRPASHLSASEHSLALCHDRIDAYVYVVGHPNPSIARATGLCDAHIAPVTGPEVDALVAENPYYIKTDIPGGIYNANMEPTPTFGVTATVLTTADMPEETVYAFVKGLFDNLDDFRPAHPAFSALEPASMVRDGLSAPLHPGAERYYREAGLLPSAPSTAETAPDDYKAEPTAEREMEPSGDTASGDEAETPASSGD